eukprot:513092_1
MSHYNRGHNRGRGRGRGGHRGKMTNATWNLIASNVEANPLIKLNDKQLLHIPYNYDWNCNVTQHLTSSIYEKSSNKWIKSNKMKFIKKYNMSSTTVLDVSSISYTFIKKLQKIYFIAFYVNVTECTSQHQIQLQNRCGLFSYKYPFATNTLESWAVCLQPHICDMIFPKLVSINGKLHMFTQALSHDMRCRYWSGERVYCVNTDTLAKLNNKQKYIKPALCNGITIQPSYHYLWNEQKNEFELIRELGINFNKVTFIPKLNIILFFSLPYGSDIYEYHLGNQQIHKLQIKLPQQMYSSVYVGFACVLFFDSLAKGIWTYNVRERSIKKSKVKPPNRVESAFIMGDILLVFGQNKHFSMAIKEIVPHYWLNQKSVKQTDQR